MPFHFVNILGNLILNILSISEKMELVLMATIPKYVARFIVLLLTHLKFGHPTEKPLPLLSKLISVGSNENDIILDPFLVLALQLLLARN